MKKETDKIKVDNEEFEFKFIKWKTQLKSEYSKYYLIDSENKEAFVDTTLMTSSRTLKGGVSLGKSNVVMLLLIFDVICHRIQIVISYCYRASASCPKVSLGIPQPRFFFVLENQVS